jgi:HTH-type transcriptional regulator / antitoxin HigA
MTTATLKKKIASTKSYKGLVDAYPPRPIRNLDDLEKAYAVIEQLMSMKKPTSVHLEFLEVLSTLVEQYEEIDHPTPRTSISSLVAHLMEAKGESQTSVAKTTGIQKSLLSEVISGRRKLSIENIKRLAKHFSVDPGLFLECE